MLGLLQNGVVGSIAAVLLYLCVRFYQRYRKVDARLLRLKNHAYDAFENQLITVENTAYRRVDGAVLLTNQYIYEKTDFDSLEEYPQFFTGIGILGTFIGVVIGLIGFSSQVSNGTGLDDMQMVISDMVYSVGFAFGTSLFGLLLSLVSTFFLSKIRNQIDDIREQFVDDYNQKYPLFKPEELLLNTMLSTRAIQQTSEKQITEFRHLSDMVADAIESALMGREGREGIVPLLQSMINKQDEIGDSFQSSLDQALGNISSSQTEGVGDIVNQFMTEMSNSFGQSFSSLGDSMSQMIASTSNYQQSMETMVQQLQQTTQQQQGAASQVQQAVASTATTLNQVEGVVSGISTTVSSLSDVGTQLTQNIETQQAFNQQMVEQFESTKSDWLAQHDAVKSISSELVQNLQGLNQALAGLQNWHSSIHNALSDNVTSWKDGLAIQKEVNTEIAENQSKALQNTQQLNNVIEQLNPISTSLQANQAKLTELMEKFGGSVDTLEGLGGTLQEQHTRALEQWGSVQTQLETSSQALGQGIRDYAEHVNDFTKTNLNDWNSTLESAVRSLSQGVNGLHEITEELETVFEHLSNVKGS